MVETAQQLTKKLNSFGQSPSGREFLRNMGVSDRTEGELVHACPNADAIPLTLSKPSAFTPEIS
jgi:hypothetical protein